MLRSQKVIFSKRKVKEKDREYQNPLDLAPVQGLLLQKPQDRHVQ